MPQLRLTFTAPSPFPDHRGLPSLPTPGLRALAALGVLVIGCALAVAGCAKPRASEPPAFVRQPNLNLAAQTTLFEEARGHLKGGRPHAAIRLLTHLIQRHPHSPLLPDMRYHLGRAYEQTGNVVAATESYRALITDTRTDDPKNRRLIAHARRRLANLTPTLEGAGPRIFNGLLLAAADVPSGPDRAPWLTSLRQAGVTDLVLEIGTPPGEGSASRPDPPAGGEGSATDPPPAGVYFRTSWAPVVEDLFEKIIPAAKERDIAVYGAVTLRRMGWLGPQEGWADVRYDPETGQLGPSPSSDLMHPGFQHYLGGLMIDLVDAGVEGIVFRGDAPLGPGDGLSAFAISEFEQAFGVRIEPASWFAGREAGSPAVTAPRYPPEFWRWAGWKSREHLAIMGKLATAMRQHRVNLRVGVELHAAAIVDPALALVQYGEDVVEAKRAGFDFLVLPMEDPGNRADIPASLPIPIAVGAEDDRPPTPMGRAIELMDDPHRVWLARPLPEGAEPSASVSIRLSAEREQLHEPVGLLYVPPQLALP